MYAISLKPMRRPKLRSVPLATPNEVLELVQRAQQGDLQARDEVIRANMGFVYLHAMHCARHTSNDADDLAQEGVLGLIRAIEKFDASLGVKFLTYAANWVRAFIGRAIEKNDAVLSGSLHLLIRYRGALREYDRLILLGESPQQALEQARNRIAHKVSLTELVKHFDALRNIKPYSLDMPYGNEDDGTTILDALPSPIEWKSDERIDLTKRDARIRGLMRKLRPKLTKVDQAILDMRIFPADGEIRTLQVVADVFGMSRERIRQRESRIIKRIRVALTKNEVKEARCLARARKRAADEMTDRGARGEGSARLRVVRG